MAVQDILNQYGIKMQNQTVTQHDGTAINDKVFYGGLNLEFFFDLAFNNPEDISDEILAKIDPVIGKNSTPLNAIDNALGGTDTNAIIYCDAVRFHKPATGEILQTVPINDFKIIATAWRDFLLQPPLIGTRIK